MVLIAQIALGVIIGLAQAAEPKGTLTLACQGTKSETTPRIADADQSSVSVDIIIDFGPRPLRCTRGTTPCGPNHRSPSAQVLTLKMTPSFIRAHGTGLRA